MFEAIAAWATEWSEWLQVGVLVWVIAGTTAGINKLIGIQQTVNHNLILACQQLNEKHNETMIVLERIKEEVYSLCGSVESECSDIRETIRDPDGFKKAMMNNPRGY